MVHVNTEDCNGCGACVDVCPTGAMILQNNHAFIQQDLCQTCEMCVESCPNGAIVSEEMLPVSLRAPRVPATKTNYPTMLEEPAERPSLREITMPIIQSVLLWAGQDLLPRLADIAMGYWEQRIQSVRFAPNPQVINPDRRKFSGFTPKHRRRHRQRKGRL